MENKTVLHRPKQAVILAGGRGTRLLPLTQEIPKPMIRFHGKPFLEYLIELLKEQGFTKILLLLGYLPDVIIDYFGDGDRFGIQIEYNISSVDDETGRRLFLAKDKIDPIFFLLYCDNYLPFSFEKIWKIFCEKKARALITVYSNQDFYTKSNVKLNAEGRVAIYDKTRSAKGLQGVDAGYMLFDHSVLDLLPSENVSFEKTVFPLLVNRGELYAYVTHHRYYSVGDHQRLPMTDIFFKRQPIVFIDRDGVLNEKMPRGEYVNAWEMWKWLPKAKEALRLFTQAGYKIIVVTNQAGIARGMLSIHDLEVIHENMKREVTTAGGRIDAIYYCPHHWDENCFCRKPSPGMLFMAQREHHLDLSRVLFIGDDDRDGMAANAAGTQWIQVTDKRTLYDIACSLVKEHVF